MATYGIGVVKLFDKCKAVTVEAVKAVTPDSLIEVLASDIERFWFSGFCSDLRDIVEFGVNDCYFELITFPNSINRDKRYLATAADRIPYDNKYNNGQDGQKCDMLAQLHWSDFTPEAQHLLVEATEQYLGIRRKTFPTRENDPRLKKEDEALATA